MSTSRKWNFKFSSCLDGCKGQILMNLGGMLPKKFSSTRCEYPADAGADTYAIGPEFSGRQS